ncbi:disease resistance protein RPP13-like [Brachypodium distachyon]|nr:disease resistance protein RPP13-like [Brachypodium distachyon]|eukprot:XP_024318534.1 disease resistance protein RPP13-like [Brachypodium distachyon]
MDITTGAMASLLPKLYELLKEQYKLHKGVKKEVQSLSKELSSMHAALRKVGRVPREQLDEQVKIWADDVRELSYNMEDVVDTFLVRVEGSEPAADLDGFRSLIKKMSNLFKNGKARHQIADMIKDIKDQVHDAAARRDRYRVDSVVANPDATAGTLDPRLSAMYNKLSDLVGIGEPRDEIIKRLTVKNDGVETVSIAGFGGLGKTALAKAVYDSLKAEFHCTTFVSVSQNPEITRIFKKMLHMLDEDKYANINEASWDETQLIDELRKFLQNKRYLIVIDDLWKIQSWKTIKYALVENSCGSRIITTTRDFDIADQVGGSYKLKPLSLESSKVLFYGRIFGSEEKCPEQLAEVSLKILKKCGGVPLAVITMASLLTVASKTPNPREWDQVCDSIGSGLGNNPDVKDMRTILSLSYYNLPSHLRTCLLYLAIYPEDYEVPRDCLIWKWIAEGFIPENIKDGRSLFEVGVSYYNELISRCMIQPIEYPEGCRLHDMMLELICSLSSEENFVSILDHIEDITSPQRNSRRTSLQNKRENHQTTTPFCMSVTQVRSVTVFRPAIDLLPPLLSYGVLRVLDLSGCDLE